MLMQNWRPKRVQQRNASFVVTALLVFLRASTVLGQQSAQTHAPLTLVSAAATESDETPLALGTRAPNAVLSLGLVLIDTVNKNSQPWIGGVAKLGVAITGRTRVGAILLGAAQPDSDNEARQAIGFLASQSFYLTRHLDFTGFVGVGRETYTYPNMNYNYGDTSTHGLWIYPGLSLDFMYRYESFQIGGGPFLAIPYHGIQSGPEIDNVKDDRYVRSGFGGSFGGQVFVGI